MALAISGALTLLTNIVMAWNTQHIQSLRDQNPDDFSDNVVAQLAPIAHVHISMRGVISFHLDRAAKGFIVPAKLRSFRQTAKKLIHKLNQ